MKPKRKRLYFAIFGLGALGGAALLILTALEDSLLYFYTPSQLAELVTGEIGAEIRLGGLVEEGSVVKDGTLTIFTITDLTNTVTVVYRGLLPNLFREGQGVIVEGGFGNAGEDFTATRVLAKHDETYMPKEVADALKKQGVWRESQPGAAP